MLGERNVETYGRSARDLRNETRDPGVSGARAALETFYFAFNNRSLAAVESVWAPDGSACLANPLGALLFGADEIRALYRRVFEGTARVWVEYHDITEFAGADSVLFVGRERGEFQSAGATVGLAIRTTRYFRFLGVGGWRQVHHHGSIDDPGLLARYQEAVRGAVSLAR